MEWGMYLFEYLIDFIELLICFYFITRFYDKSVPEKGKALLCFSAVGALAMFLREMGIIPLPDFAVPIAVLFLYAWRICHTSVGSAVFISVLNYLLVGVINIGFISFLKICFGIEDAPMPGLENRVLILVSLHLAQLILFEMILKFKNRIFGKVPDTRQMDTGILLVQVFSILVLAFFQNIEYHWTQETIHILNLVISFLILAGNFVLFFFKTILARERKEKAALQEHNRLAQMQLRNQRDMGELYENIRMLRHDISSHLTAIFGYIELERYQKARDYIEELRKEMDSLEPVHTGNVTLDALLGSKGVLARKNSISVELDAAVPPDLWMEETHLAVMLGNLYDNAIDASLKIEDKLKRYIRIEIAYREGNLMICFSNAAKEDAKRDGDVWHTTKERGSEHGFGIRSIDRIVRQYNGFITRELKDNVFTCWIRVPDMRAEG